MVTSLYTFDAKIILQSRHDTRTVPVEDFFLAPGKTVIEKGELILGFEIDDRFGLYNQIYYKLGQRKALACAKVSLAMAAANTQNNVIRDVRIAFGAVAPTVIRAKNLEAYLNGRTYSSVRAEDIDKCLATDVAPIDDIRSTGEYRLKMCSVLVKRGLNEFMTKK
jgi:carbon-monoxide dehydrogenase medium subunit